MKIFRFLIIFFLLILKIFAKDLSPEFSLIASGAVTDLVLKEDKLFVATSASSVDIFNINTKKKLIQ